MSRPGAARTILLSHIISARPSKQPLMVRTFLKVYMELGFYFLFLQEQIKDIIIIVVCKRGRAGRTGQGSEAGLPCGGATDPAAQAKAKMCLCCSKVGGRGDEARRG